MSDRTQLALPLDADVATQAALYVERVEAVLSRLETEAVAIAAAVASAREQSEHAVAAARQDLETLAALRSDAVVLVSSTQSRGGRVFHSATRPCGRVTGARSLPEDRWQRLFATEARARGLVACPSCLGDRAPAHPDR